MSLNRTSADNASTVCKFGQFQMTCLVFLQCRLPGCAVNCHW